MPDKEVKELDELTKEELKKTSHVKDIMSQIGKLTREERIALHDQFEKLYWQEGSDFSVGKEFDAKLYEV